VFICVLFNFVDCSCHCSFEFIVLYFILFTIIQVLYCRTVDFWKRYVALLFHITCIFTPGKRFWLALLIFGFFSIRVFTLFRQDLMVTGFWCIFSLLDSRGLAQ
jgi:hypothetical protein